MSLDNPGQYNNINHYHVNIDNIILYLNKFTVANKMKSHFYVVSYRPVVIDLLINSNDIITYSLVNNLIIYLLTTESNMTYVTVFYRYNEELKYIGYVNSLLNKDKYGFRAVPYTNNKIIMQQIKFK